MDRGGCKTCPVQKCDAIYRGNRCDAYRARYGLGDPMTNAEKIRRMTDEELAEFITERCIESLCDIACEGECKAIGTLGMSSYEVCKQIVAKWLQQPAKEN